MLYKNKLLCLVISDIPVRFNSYKAHKFRFSAVLWYSMHNTVCLKTAPGLRVKTRRKIIHHKFIHNTYMQGQLMLK